MTMYTDDEQDKRYVTALKQTIVDLRVELLLVRAQRDMAQSMMRDMIEELRATKELNHANTTRRDPGEVGRKNSSMGASANGGNAVLPV